MKIIGYTYEAGFHCASHAEARFPALAVDPIAIVRDKEGNEIRPVYDTDEQPRDGYVCDEGASELVTVRDMVTDIRIKLKALRFAWMQEGTKSIHHELTHYYG